MASATNMGTTVNANRMSNTSIDNGISLSGVVAAVPTPVRDGRPYHANLERHVQQLAVDGCDGILLLGTTGEGPSFSLDERASLIEAGCEFAGDLKVMAGTGCASLPDTIWLTRRAFEIGVAAVVVIPPFYFKGVSDEGLLVYYRTLLDEAVPDDGHLILYHIPQMTGVPISFGLIEKLLALGDKRVAGIKDSSGNLDHTRALCQRFPDLAVFVGDDKLLYQGLQFGAAGCIAAGVNLLAPLAADVYRVFHDGKSADEYQERLTAARLILDEYKPFPASVKGMLSVRYGTVGWEVRPPLTSLPEEELKNMGRELWALELPQQYFRWLYGAHKTT